MKFKKLGLCLSGGGGKGAYQIGAWEAMIDFRLADQISEISGTSVGGLNGAMVAQKKFDQAKHMWLNIASRNMLSSQDIPGLASSLATLTTKGVMSPLLENFISTKGLFKPDGLRSMISEGLDIHLMASSALPLTVALHNTKTNRVDYGKVNNSRTAANMLFGTAALPLIFDELDIDGNVYTDGGFYWGVPNKQLDNTPITPLIESGCDTIVMVCMSPEDLNIRPGNYPGVRIIPIIPTQGMGGVLATLDFSNEGAARRMTQGYSDATKILHHLALFLENEAEYEALWRKAAVAAEQEQKNNEGLFRVDSLHHQTVVDIHDFNRQISSDDFSRPLRLADDEVSHALDSLALENTSLLNDIERRDIEAQVDSFINRNSNNKRAIETAALDALAALSPLEGRATHLSEQGFLSRLWGSITGNNQRIFAENDKNLAQAQFAALRLIAAVQQKGTLTLEFACTLQNRINSTQKDIERLGNRHNQDLRRVYRSLAGVYCKLRDKLNEHSSRLDKLERSVRLHDWLLHPNKIRLDGKPLNKLPPVLRLCYLTNDFFRLTEGQWEIRELHSLHEMCIGVGLDEEKPISIEEFCTQVVQRPARLTLTENLAVLPDTDNTLDALNPIGHWLHELRSVGLSEMDGLTALAHLGYGTTTALPAWDFVVELLYHFKAAGFAVVHSSDIAGYKANWLEQLGSLEQLIHDNILPKSFDTEIQQLRSSIQDFRLKVPLIGKFSVGKSTLLNSWLGQNIQKVDLGACTNLATEFYYAEPGHEKLVACWPDATQGGNMRREELLLSAYPDCLNRWQSRGDIPAFIEIHLSSSALAQHPDLVLVDTPGLGSTNGQHEQAIQEYIGEAVSCILCVTRTSQVGIDEQQFIERQRSLGQDFSLLVCQEALSNPSERESLRKSLAMQAGLDSDAAVPACSALEGDFSGFQDVLARIEFKKEELFKKRFTESLGSLIRLAERLIKQQLSSDTTTDQLREKKKQIDKDLVRLEDNFNREHDSLMKDCNGPVMRQVVAMVSSHLRSRRQAYAQMLLGGQGIGPLLAADARNAGQLAIEQHLTPRLRQACTQLESHIEFGAFDGPSVDGIHGPEGMDSSSWGGTAAGAATGIAIGGLIGGLIGGTLGFFTSRSSKESEAESKAMQAIESVIDRLQGGLSETIGRHASQFLTQMRGAISIRIEAQRENITRIEEQLTADANRRQQIELRAQQALTQLAHLTQEQSELTTTA
ncbi:patatin-like phospholipase family protein [Leptothrix ochracea]|uniref:patatin-like phospholipase family protein n=1 Tax=Leptothrix ochracea TaxID=735331 RepID=UPI0034E24094